jgi:hypothetical protein
MHPLHLEETGIDGLAPVVTMTGIVMNDEESSKTQRESENARAGCWGRWRTTS